MPALNRQDGRNEDSGSKNGKIEKTIPELPKLTVANVVKDIASAIRFMLFDPRACRIVIPVLVPVASILAKIVIANVRYTEIDFSTYMQQIELVNAGVLDYSMITGDSGPIVYPAGYVQVYQALYWLTDGGGNLVLAQKVFGYLFALTIAFTCAVYSMVGNLPPWPLYLLLCSRRLISIYVLRMFNDCFTTLAMICVVLLLQVASYWSNVLSGTSMLLLCGVAADVYSMAISVKMNALLYMPAFVITVYFLLGECLSLVAVVLCVIPMVQVLIGWKFLLPLFWDDEARYLRWAYISNAFDFSRQFLYKWTVNWKFVSPECFLSSAFSRGLLVAHISLLLVFIFARFISRQVTKKSVLTLVTDAIASPFTKTVSRDNLLLTKSRGPKLVLLMFASTNLIGVLCSRSLHYQFLSWYCWLLPFLLYATGASMPVAVAVFFVHEWSWNVFPATAMSSKILVLILILTLVAIGVNNNNWEARTAETSEEKKTQ